MRRLTWSWTRRRPNLQSGRKSSRHTRASCPRQGKVRRKRRKKRRWSPTTRSSKRETSREPLFWPDWKAAFLGGLEDTVEPLWEFHFRIGIKNYNSVASLVCRLVS